MPLAMALSLSLSIAPISAQARRATSFRFSASKGVSLILLVFFRALMGAFLTGALLAGPFLGGNLGAASPREESRGDAAAKAPPGQSPVKGVIKKNVKKEVQDKSSWRLEGGGAARICGTPLQRASYEDST